MRVVKRVMWWDVVSEWEAEGLGWWKGVRRRRWMELGGLSDGVVEVGVDVEVARMSHVERTSQVVVRWGLVREGREAVWRMRVKSWRMGVDKLRKGVVVGRGLGWVFLWEVVVVVIATRLYLRPRNVPIPNPIRKPRNLLLLESPQPFFFFFPSRPSHPPRARRL